MNKWTTIITGLLTITLAGFAFALSYANLYAMAAEAGVKYPALIPLTIEGAVLVFSVAMLRNSLHGDDTRVLWGLIIGSSVLATVFNVYHSDTSKVISMVMAGVPSLFLLLSFETFISQIKKVAARSQAEQSFAEFLEMTKIRRRQIEAEVEQAEVSAIEAMKRIEQEEAEVKRQAERLEAELTAKRQKLEAEIEALKKEVVKKKPKLGAKEKRQKKLAEIYKPEMTYAQLAETLKVHPNTVANDVKEMGLNGRG